MGHKTTSDGEIDSVGGVEGFIVLGGIDDEAVAVDGAVFDGIRLLRREYTWWWARGGCG